MKLIITIVALFVIVSSIVIFKYVAWLQNLSIVQLCIVNDDTKYISDAIIEDNGAQWLACKAEPASNSQSVKRKINGHFGPANVRVIARDATHIFKLPNLIDDDGPFVIVVKVQEGRPIVSLTYNLGTRLLERRE